MVDSGHRVSASVIENDIGLDGKLGVIELGQVS